MKKFIFLFSLLSVVLHAQYHQKNDSLYQILKSVNEFKENPYEKKYRLISNFAKINAKTTVAKVLTNEGWGMITKSGKEFIPAKYTEVFFDTDKKIISGLVKDSSEERIFDFYNLNGEIIEKNLAIGYSKGVHEPKSLPVFIFNKEGFYGVKTLNGKQIIPNIYTNIFVFGKWLFCEDYPKKTTFIFDENGKLQKSLNSTNIQNEIKNSVQVFDNDELRYLLGLKTLEPVTKKYSWGQFHEYFPDGELIEHYDYYNKEKSHILTGNFQEINPIEFPGSKVLCDKFVISKNDTANVVFNFNGKIVGKYSKDDFDIFETFGKCRLDNPKFLSDLKKKYQNIDKVELVSEDTEYNLLSTENRKKIYIIDENTGKIMVSKQNEKYFENAYLYILPNSKAFFAISFNDKTFFYKKNGDYISEKTLKLN